MTCREVADNIATTCARTHLLADRPLRTALHALIEGASPPACAVASN